MNKYYYLGGKMYRNSVFAYSEIDTASPEMDLLPKLVKMTKLNFRFILKKNTKIKIEDTKNIWVDYQPNDYAWPLMSEKLKSIINDRLTGKEKIVWMEVIIKSGKEKRLYFIPRFEKKLDVLDKAKTQYGDRKGSIIIPAFLKEKVIKYSMFFTPQEFWQISPDIIVVEEIKKAIQKEKLTGIVFEEAIVT